MVGVNTYDMDFKLSKTIFIDKESTSFKINLIIRNQTWKMIFKIDCLCFKVSENSTKSILKLE